MDQERLVDTGRLASAVGLAAIAAPVTLATFFAIGGPFGTVNDLCNAAVGVLSGALAWRLQGSLDERVRGPALTAAGVGAAVTVIGSSLVLSRTTGFFFAGLVTSVGFALIGCWLIALSLGPGTRPWPAFRRLGLVAGSLMSIGLVALPGIALGLDDQATAPAWVWIAFLAWLGIFVVYPAWALLLGARGASGEGSSIPMST